MYLKKTQVMSGYILPDDEVLDTCVSFPPDGYISLPCLPPYG